MDSKRYVSIGDGNVYLVQNDPLNYFDVDLHDMIDNDKTPVLDNVTSVQFEGGENYNIIYEEESTNTYCAADVYFAQQNGKSLPLDTSKVNSYLRTISYLNPTEYVSYNATEEELHAYGLDTPELTVTVGYTEEDEDGKENQDTFVLHISRDPEEIKSAAETAVNDDGDIEEETITAYARIGESQIIYSLSSDSYKSLMAVSYDDLRHREVLWADYTDVKQIDISLEEASYTITSEKDGEDRVYSYQGEELESEDFLNALEALNADSFTNEAPTQKEEISLIVYLDNENYPQISIKLYRYNGTNCLAMVDGQSVSLVDRTAVIDLIEAVHAIVLS